jgi:hypothetical protein
MDSGNQTGEGVKIPTQITESTENGPVPDPNFETIASKAPNAIELATKALDSGKKVLLDEIGLNSSEL